MQTPAFPAAFSSCPAPLPHRTTITLGHGGGGRLTEDLLNRLFRPAFANPGLEARHDGATFQVPAGRLAFSTDSHVVSPLFFPGGDIGELAVYGTVNDLAMCGARPQALSAAFILEEGLPVETLERVVHSMAAAARKAGVCIATGDTKVVERGKADGLYICTSGIGLCNHSLEISPASVREGDLILLNGDVGRHGMAIMASREHLAFESPITSDCAPLAAPVLALLAAGLTPHCLRDLTRGGLATCLIEIAESSGLDLLVDETAIPVSEAVHGACEILGFDPLYVANEGRFLCILPSEQAGEALRLLSEHSSDTQPALVGRVLENGQGRVRLKSLVGAERFLERLSGEQLPRIC